ncbi:MAG TPA: hypothetical protein VHB21_22810, partial [Minicystis sp.]|nr:hypothetical protein [Minicystis sp.]
MRAARTTTARTQRALAAVALFAYAASCRAPPANAPPIDGDEDDEPVAAPPPRVGVPAPAPRCGRERWSVKVGTDADARAVDLAHPREGTIDAMRA